MGPQRPWWGALLSKISVKINVQRDREDELNRDRDEREDDRDGDRADHGESHQPHEAGGYLRGHYL